MNIGQIVGGASRWFIPCIMMYYASHNKYPPLKTHQIFTNKVNGQWVERTGRRNETDAQGRLITANNGPFGGNEREINRTGFFVRKYLDKTPLAGTQGTKSAMWNVYFRISEAYLIAAEASWELSRNNSDVEALKYINAVRERAGIQPLTSIDHQKIMHEYQVEFAFEGHRWWNAGRYQYGKPTGY